jgi:hypothetical protein
MSRWMGYLCAWPGTCAATRNRLVDIRRQPCV